MRATTLQEVGRIAEAGEWLDAAAKGVADGSFDGDLAAVAAGVAASQSINQYFLGDVSGMAETARPALDLEEGASDYWRSALLTTYGVSRFLGGDAQAASALLDEAVSLSESSSHSLAQIHALGWCAVVHAELGDVERADGVLGAADALLRREPGLANYIGMSMTHVARGALLERQGHWAEADEALAAGHGARPAGATPSSTTATACSRMPG